MQASERYAMNQFTLNEGANSGVTSELGGKGWFVFRSHTTMHNECHKTCNG